MQVLAGWLLCALVAKSPIAVERIFGPELPGKYKHPATITELDNGDLYLAYFCGSGEYEHDTAVHSSRLVKGSTKWTAPEKITANPPIPEGNPVVWQAPDGKVWLFNVVRHGKTWSTSTIDARISEDGAKTWGKPFPLTTEQGTMVRSRPVSLPSGDFLLPIYHETGDDPESVGPDTTSFFLRYEAANKSWSETNRVHSRIGNLQPAAAVVDGDYLVAYCRRGGNYLPTKDGYLVRTESRDGGKTWTDGKDSAFFNPHSAVDFIRLKSGHLLLVFNDSMNERNPLSVALSADGDKTYPYKRVVADAPDGDFAYPTMIQTKDGKIHIIYTSHKRTVINHAVFDEEAVLEKK